MVRTLFQSATASCCGLALAALFSFEGAYAKGFQVLHKFNNRTGFIPVAGLIQDAAGNLYGTTWQSAYPYDGTVFKIATDGTFTTLYLFCSQTNCTDGAYPRAGLILDSSGNLYGTTGGGGTHGYGTVFRLAPDGTETVLYSFAGGSDGDGPLASLLADAAGNFYGTTYYGGTGTGCAGGDIGCGIIFKVTPVGVETVLYSFGGYPGDGTNPQAGLVADKKGNLYGTTSAGGGSENCNNDSPGCGTVFKFTTDGVEKVLHSFTSGGDGAYPVAGLLMDKSNNLYGTTENGGSTNCGDRGGCGTVFKLTPDRVETVLYSFCSGSCLDGIYPESALIADKKGNLYGTPMTGDGGNGTVFKLTPDGTERVLTGFGHIGAAPVAGVIADAQGNLYGTTSMGGINCYGYTSGCGIVFKLEK